MHGGAQERGRRASTENVPGIVGLGKPPNLQDRIWKLKHNVWPGCVTNWSPVLFKKLTGRTWTASRQAAAKQRKYQRRIRGGWIHVP